MQRKPTRYKPPEIFHPNGDKMSREDLYLEIHRLRSRWNSLEKDSQAAWGLLLMLSRIEQLEYIEGGSELVAGAMALLDGAMMGRY